MYDMYATPERWSLRFPLRAVLWLLLISNSFAHAASSLITFTVNLTVQANNGSFVPGTDMVAVRGTFNGYGTYFLTNNPGDASGGNLYSGTINDTNDANGGQLQYKFWTSHPSAPNGGWESTANGINRAAVLPATIGASLTLPTAYFGDVGTPVSDLMTFRVDMSLQMSTGAFNTNGGNTVELQGGFNNWTSGATLTRNPSLTVTNVYGLVTSNVYAGSFPIVGSPGQIEDYKFVIQPGNHYELPNSINLDGSGNRFVPLLGKFTLPIFPFSDAPYGPLATNTMTFAVDMTAQVLRGLFIPGTDTVDVRGNFNGWAQGVNICTNDPYDDNTNIYRSVVVITAGIGATEQYKFTFYPNNTTNTIWENPVSSPTIGGNRYFVQPNLTATSLPVVFFSDDNNTNFWLVYTFSKSDGSPSGGMILSGDTLYGTTGQGGNLDSGMVFKVNIDGTSFTRVYNFTGWSDGHFPSGLILSGNTLYGAVGSPTYGPAAVFKVNSDGTGYTNLYYLAGNAQGGTDIQLTLSGNTVYGVADYSGDWYAGLVFKANSDGSFFTNVYTFGANGDDPQPSTRLVLSGNILYGTTAYGGNWNNGAVFKVNIDGTGFTYLYSFTSFTGATYNYPTSGLILSGSTLYGTKWGDGTFGKGTVFKVNTDGTGFTNLYSFTGGGDGAFPNCLLLSGKTLFGTTEYGGNSIYGGTVFTVNTDGTSFTSLYKFTGGGDGLNPLGNLNLSGNILYGTASAGGNLGYGTVFAIMISNTPPQIITAPADLMVIDGDPAEFSIEAAGTPPLSYHWQFNGTNLVDSGRISGSHTATLSIASVTPSDAGAYQAFVTNAFGSTTSAPAILTVVGMQDIIPAGEYNALVDFYNSTHGSAWLQNSNWLAPHAYPWFGVTVDGIGYDDAGNFISPGNVSDLALGTNNLNGPFPGDFTFLTKLVTLDLSSNRMSGSIPLGFSVFGSTMESLDLSYNNFTGNIPVDLVNLPLAQSFFLNNNSLNGPIPTGISSLAQAVEIDLSHNSLNGLIPASLGSCAFLKSLDLSVNTLTNSIPTQLSQMAPLQYLDLHSNQLSGPIPLGWGSAYPLQFLDLSENQLTGGIPAGLGNMLHLDYLDLSENDLHGLLPSFTGDYALQSLYLAGNSFTGGIRADFVTLPFLVNLDLSDNFLTGNIPDFSGLPKFQSLEIPYNNLAVNSQLPAGVANLITISNMLGHGVTVDFLPQNKPYITNQPAGETVANGSPAQLSVGADGAPPLAYQWQVGGVSLADSGRISGSHSNVLNLSASYGQDDGYYQVVITNAYESVTSAPAMLTVQPALVFLTWTNPAAVTYGTPLGANQLNASANVAGTFLYAPPAGTVPAAGTILLTMVFNPADPVNYNNATGSVVLVVLPAPLTVTASNTTRPYGQTNPILAGTLAGLQNGDNITAVYACGATPTSVPGNYPIIPALVDPGNRLVNYLVTTNPGTLTVQAAATVLTLTNNLELWLRADAGVTTNSTGGVSAWTDQSGAGHNATQVTGTTQPVLVNGGWAGQPVVRFGTGGSQFMNLAGQVLTNRQFTIFAAVNSTSTGTGNREFFSNWASTNGFNSIYFGTTNFNPTKARLTDRFFITGAGPVTNPATHVVLTGVSGATNVVLYQGRNQIAVTNDPLPSGMILTSPYAIGRQG
jgi:uncharacterized repeat protein (TIGR03803 family)